MPALRSRIAQSGLATPLGFLLRARSVLRFLLAQAGIAARWVVRSRETTNHSYDITPLNRVHLAWFVANAVDVPVSRVEELFAELDSDHELRHHLEQVTAASPFRRVSDPRPPYGRRLAWYALVRLLQPQVVVETGIDKGLGSCVLAAALLRNGSGHLYAIDTAAVAGWMVSGPYARCVTVLHDDAVHAITGLSAPVDLLVHDVHHTPEQEVEEYTAVLERSPRAALINDNAHSYDVLPALCEKLGLRYHHFDDKPSGTWFAGSGLGLGLPSPGAASRSSRD